MGLGEGHEQVAFEADGGKVGFFGGSLEVLGTEQPFRPPERTNSSIHVSRLGSSPGPFNFPCSRQGGARSRNGTALGTETSRETPSVEERTSQNLSQRQAFFFANWLTPWKMSTSRGSIWKMSTILAFSLFHALSAGRAKKTVCVKAKS